MKEHILKTWPEYFNEIYHGAKNWELRKNDRDFRVGDMVILQEWDNENKSYTGNYVHTQILFILKDAPQFGLMDGYCILSLDTDRKQGFSQLIKDL